jgi:hypothetical protein
MLDSNPKPRKAGRPRGSVEKTLAKLVAIAITITATSTFAGDVTRNLFGVGVLVGGVALYNEARKGCHPVKDPDTGLISWFCDKGPLADTSGATLRTFGTYQLRKALNTERVSAGMPPDPDDCDAHHIVPKGESRPWAKSMVNSAGEVLLGCVDLDAAENGVFLPNKKTGSPQCQGQYHKTLHTERYYSVIEQRLSAANRQERCSGVKLELESIKKDLVSGGLW